MAKGSIAFAMLAVAVNASIEMPWLLTLVLAAALVVLSIALLRVLCSAFTWKPGAPGPLRSLTPASFCERGFMQPEPRVAPARGGAGAQQRNGDTQRHSHDSLQRSGSGLGQGCWHMLSSLTVLGTFLFVPVALRVAPYAWQHFDGRGLGESVFAGFPDNFEVFIANGTLRHNLPLAARLGEGGARDGRLRASLPQVLFDAGGGSLYEFVGNIGSLGVPDLHPIEVALRLSLDLFNGADPYPRVREYSIGERLEVRLEQDLLACGFPKRLWPLPVGGAWLPAIVLDVHQSGALSEFRYSLQLAGPDNEVGLICKARAINLRRPRHMLFAAPGEELDLDDLQGERATLVFEETRFAVLEGFSFVHEQHWQYALGSSGDADGETSKSVSRARLWHEYTEEDMKRYLPMALLTDAACVQEGREGWQRRCSAAIARDNFLSMLEAVPGLTTAVHWNLHILGLFVYLWVCCVLATVLKAGVAITFLYTPVAYVACCLLRHVDTPVVPIKQIYIIVMYSSIPKVVLPRLLRAAWDIWGVEGHLHPVLHSGIEWARKSDWKFLLVWALWNGYLVIRMRQHVSTQERLRMIRRSSDKEQKAAASTGEQTDENESGRLDSAASTAQCLASAGVPQQSAAGMDDEDEGAAPTPACRICLGGTEAGRLISPCLCTGTMRFVHAECLNAWRAASSNPQSYYHCDQCRYRYSFGRTTYANILRSALVLHLFTIVAFLGTVVLCGHLAFLVEPLFMGDSGFTSFPEAWNDTLTEMLANGTDLEVEFVREKFIEPLSSVSIAGLNFLHLMVGLSLVGFAGFVSMRIFWVPIFGGHADGIEGPVIIVIGVVRVLCGIYYIFKALSGRLLHAAESCILEVGVAADAEPDSDSTRAPRGAAGFASGEAVASTTQRANR